MLKKFITLIKRYENNAVSFGLWISTALCLIFLRDTLETVVADHSFPFVHPFHLVHVPVFFLSLLLAIIVVLHFFSGTEILKVSRLSLIMFVIILFPPVMDLIVSAFNPRDISYGYIQDNLGRNFIHFFDPFFKIPTVPPSLRIEIAILTVVSFGYIFLKRKRVLLALPGAFCVFGVCFFYGALPAIFANLYLFFASVVGRFIQFLNVIFPGAKATGPYAIRHEGTLEDPSLLVIELFMTLIFTLIWFWRYDKIKLTALLKNFRFSRVFHYLLMAIFGLGFYFYNTTVTDLFIFLKIIGILLAIFFAFQFAVVINDIFDVVCDRRTNKDRPLVTGTIEKNEYLTVGSVYLVFALLFAFFVGDYCFAITLLFVVISVLYSAPPLRLKRLFPFSSIVIGLESLIAFLLGQFSLDERGILLFRNMPLWILVFLAFSLGSNVKDLKDIEGDRESGVSTLPVFFGEVLGRKIIAVFLFLSYLAVPFFLVRIFIIPRFMGLVISSLLFGLVNLFYIVRRDADEKPVFLMYFLYIFLLLFFLR